MNDSITIKDRFIIMRKDIISKQHVACKQINVLLADYKFWYNHTEELKQYCNENKFNWEGMIVSLPSEEAAMLFKLRWA